MSERVAGRYTLLRRLGAGGMGEVWLSRDAATGSECALKRAPASATGETAGRLRREFEALARLRHPALVRVFDLGFAPDGAPFLTMEYVPGLPADRALEPRHWPSLVWLAARVAHGLEALHAAGVTHGDLKPSNVLVMPALREGELPRDLRIVDLGLASLRGQQAGGFAGTPGFAAPEVMRGEAPQPASDLYGFGAMLYALIAGEPMHRAASESSRAARQVTDPPPARLLEDAGAPPALVTLVLALLAARPGERPASAHEVMRELQRLDPAARTPLLERLATEVVVGRERELARLAPPAPGMRARSVVVEGDAGSGKSALLEQLATRTVINGGTVLRVPTLDARARGGAALAVLRQLQALAGAREGVLAPPAPLAATFAEGRGELTEALDAEATAAAGPWLAALARERGAPVLLCDDFDRVDPASRALLIRWSQLPGLAPSLWVWSTRGIGAGGDPLALLVGSGRSERLVLGPLDRPALERLVAARLAAEPPEALGEFLWTRSGGHPGLCVESLRAAAAAGAIEETDSGLRVHAERLLGTHVESDFEHAWLARCVALPEGARELALALAACNGAASEADLERVLGRPAGDDVRVARVARVVRSDEGGLVSLVSPGSGPRMLERLDVPARNALWRRALQREAIPDDERFRLLVAIGDAPEALQVAGRLFARSPDHHLAATAAALAESLGDSSAALAWHDHAARTARRSGAFAFSRVHYERALEPPAPAAERAPRWLGLGSCLLHLGDLDALTRALAQAKAEDLPVEASVRLQTIEADLLHAQGRGAESRECNELALARARESGDVAAIARAAACRAAADLLSDRSEEAEPLAREALALARRAEDAALQIYCALTMARAHHALGASSRALELLDECLAKARAAGERGLLPDLYEVRATIQIETGRWLASLASIDEALQLAIELEMPRGVAVLTGARAVIEALLGRHGTARRLTRAAYRMSRRSAPLFALYAQRVLAIVLRQTGRLERAGRVMDWAFARVPASSSAHSLAWFRVEYANLCVARGQWRELGRALEPHLPAEPQSLGEAILLTMLARGAVMRGEVPIARARLQVVDEWLSARDRPYVAAHAAQLRAEIEIAAGDRAGAAAAAEESLRLFEALPAPHDRAMAAMGFAQLALRLELAADLPLPQWLDTALELFERLGDRRQRTRALELQVEMLRRSRVVATGGDDDRDLIESVSGLLHSLSDLRELARRAMQLAGLRFQAERGVLLLHDQESGQLQPIAEYGAVDAAVRENALGYSRRAVRHVTESGTALVITDVTRDPTVTSRSMTDMRLQSLMCVPLFVGGRVMGAVYLDDSRRSRVFSEGDRGLLEGFAHLMAVAIGKSLGQQEVERANERLVGENLSLRREVDARFRGGVLIGTHPKVRQVLSLTQLAADMNTTVLITGESGTGKELVARSLHHSSKRGSQLFVALNCGAVPGTLLESELFGILKNVATGVHQRPGVFQQADGGTLFLDEIGEMPLQQQVALLGVLQNRQITPIGGRKPIPIDVRIVAATNRDLRQLVREGKFREDLYYRLAVLQIDVPPLRDRKSDIPLLAKHFVQQIAERQDRPVPEVSRDFVATLMQSDWPGNVRELENYIERVMAMTPEGELRPDPLPRDLEDRRGELRLSSQKKLVDLVEELERRMIDKAIEDADGNQSLAARMLGLTEQSLRYRLRKYEPRQVRRNRRQRKNRR